MAKVFEAQRPGTCGICEGKIKPGERVREGHQERRLRPCRLHLAKKVEG